MRPSRVEAGSVVLRETAFPARQGRRLWVYLMLHRHWPVAREDLVTAVWGLDAPEAAETALNALVSRLRVTLQPLVDAGHVVTIRGDIGRYHLDLPPDTFVDYERARLTMHQADASARAGDHHATLTASRVAMEIASRGCLPGENGPWLEGVRQTLADPRGRAQERTIAADLGRGQIALAEQEARALIMHEPLRERGYQLLMQRWPRGGNRAEVVAVLTRCRETLAREAGLHPSAATLDLARALVHDRRHGADSLAPAGSVGP